MRNLLPLLFVITLKGLAQTSTESLIWPRYQLDWQINDHWSVRQEVENRMYWFPFRQHQFLSRTHLLRPINNQWKWGFGYTHFFQYVPQNPWAEDLSAHLELRPQLELSNKTPLGEGFVLGHRYWAEFRFFESGDGFDFGALRLRYNLSLGWTKNHWRITANTEPMINWGPAVRRNVFDQNRLGLAVRRKLNNRLSLETGYIHWYQQMPDGDRFTERHILRLTLFHTL